MVKTFRYEFTRTKQGPLRRTLAFWGQGMPGQCAPVTGGDGTCVWIVKASIPFVDQHLVKYMKDLFWEVSELINI